MLLLTLAIKFFDADSEWHSLISELVRSQRRGGALMRAQRELVLLFTGDFVFPGDVLGSESHIQIKVRIVFDQIRIGTNYVAAHGDHGHRFQTTRKRNLSAAGANSIGRDGNRLQTRRAEPIDGHGAGFHGQPCSNRRCAGDVHPLLCFGHCATHDHVFDLGGFQARHARHGLFDYRGAHFIGPRVTQSALRRFANRRANCRNDYCVFHKIPLRLRRNSSASFAA